MSGWGGARQRSGRKTGSVNLGRATSVTSAQIIRDFFSLSAPSQPVDPSSASIEQPALESVEHQFEVITLNPVSLQEDENGSEQADNEHAATDGEVYRYLRSIQDNLKQELKETKTVHSVKHGQFWMNPPDPLIQMEFETSPEPFYHPLCFIWLPRVAFPWLKLHCPVCRSNANTEVHGWPTTSIARRVVSFDRCYFVFSRRYF
jgi:hypothetical protein